MRPSILLWEDLLRLFSFSQEHYFSTLSLPFNKKKTPFLLSDKYVCFTGMVLAIDINKGRLRVLKETSKLHHLNDVITTIHADLRLYSVSACLQILRGISLNLIKITNVALSIHDIHC